MNETKQKTYVPKCSAKQVEFQSGGSIMKLSFDAQTLAEFARNNKNESGYLNLCVSKRREVGRYGETHTVWLDTWRPDPSKRRGDGPSHTDNPHSLGATKVEQPEDDVPF